MSGSTFRWRRLGTGADAGERHGLPGCRMKSHRHFLSAQALGPQPAFTTHREGAAGEESQDRFVPSPISRCLSVPQSPALAGGLRGRRRGNTGRKWVLASQLGDDPGVGAVPRHGAPLAGREPRERSGYGAAYEQNGNR